MNASTPTLVRAVALAVLVAGVTASAFAADATTLVQAPPAGVLSLSSSATVQVPNDWITVEFSVARDGSDANAVQAQLKAALAQALAQAERIARPDGQVQVQGGGFSLNPRFDSNGRITGWNGSTQMVVQGHDMPAIAALAGQVSTMTVANLGYSVSREARAKVEGDVAAQAIASFRARAAGYAKAFGYGGFAVREVNVQTDEGEPRPRPVFAAKSLMSSSMPVPVSAGTGSVTANVNGSVQLN